ncbi:MAG: hypothetical protein HY241_07045 [Actinobacteria bacterium]|nr:hypothetical protein [Actinomycetota bacterium]
MDQHPLAGLRAGDDLIGLARDWVTADPVSASVHDGTTRVDLALVEQLDAMVLKLRHLDDEIGGTDLLPIVRQRYQRVTDLLGGSYTSEVGRRLHATAANLGHFLGWLAYDSSMHGFAQRQWVAALHAAHSAADTAMGANILAGMALQSYNLDRPHDGLTLAQTAEEGLGAGGSSTVRAMLVARQAVAAAKLGDSTTSGRALHRAETLLDADDPDAPEWIYYFGRADEQIHAGICWLTLGDPTRAEATFQAVLETIDPTYIRDRATVLIRIARARIQRNDIESAATTATDALLLAVSQVSSMRVADQLADVDQALTRFRTSVPAASDFHERYLDLISSNPT